MAKRGKIVGEIKNGLGLISLDGRILPFSVQASWKAETAPTTGMEVSVETSSDGAISAVFAAQTAEDTPKTNAEVLAYYQSRATEEVVAPWKAVANFCGVAFLGCIVFIVVGIATQSDLFDLSCYGAGICTVGMFVSMALDSILGDHFVWIYPPLTDEDAVRIKNAGGNPWDYVGHKRMK